MSESTNKRTVKKTNTKKMNIKVSTEDKDSPSKNNLNADKNTKSKGKENQPETLEQRLSNLLENNQNLENELDNVKEELKSEEENGIKNIGSLNAQIEKLNKSQTKESNQNKTLLNKLKKLEGEVSKKFQDKFKVSKVIEKQKAIIQERDINKEIKSKENETKNVQKDIKINEREIKRITKLLEENKDGGEKKLDQQYNELKEKIEKIQKEVNDLNLIKFQHKYCTKNANKLKSQINVLSNDCEFESKRKTMISYIPPKQEKKEKEEEEQIQRINYGNRIRKKLMKTTKNKYDSRKVKTITHRSYNFLQNEMNDNTKKKRNNSSKQNQEVNENEKTNKKEKNNVYLFTEAEKEVFKKLVPNEYFNNVNDKVNERENEITEIEEAYQDKKSLKKKLYLDNLRYDEINLKEKELKMIKSNLMATHIKNNKKIMDIKNQIKKVENEINKEQKKIERIVYRNSNLKEIINKFKKKLKEGKEENKEAEQ